MTAGQQRNLKISRAAGNSEDERELLVQVTLDGELLHESLRLVEPFPPSSSERANLRWYLEQYASQEPFDSDRAREVAASINTYAKVLHSQLQVYRIFQKNDPLVDENHALTIDVCGSYTEELSPTVSLHSFHWELLEQLDLWSGFFSKVTVSRISPQPIMHSSTIAPSTPCIQAHATETVNVLVVIARKTEINPTAYQDTRPFAALDVLLGMGKILQQQHAGTPRLRVEVVRPGTFDALKRHLKNATDAHGPGFYHLVHLDMHGRVAKRRLASGETVEAAWLDFAASGSAPKRKPVPAESVAKLLVEHGVVCAILNACESARADRGAQANLALRFLESGVGSVLAMSYEFPACAVESFFSAFYDGLLCRGLPMSAAAADARKELREHELRKSRFGLEVQVRDWFIPVSYVCRQEYVVFSAPLVDLPAVRQPFSSPNPTRKRIMGREFDLLRLEEAVADSNLILVHGLAGVGKSEFVKYAFDLWGATDYFDEFSVVDLFGFLVEREFTASKIISKLAKDLKVSEALLVADDSNISSETAGSHQTRKAVIALDGIDNIFNNVFNEGLEPIVEALAALLRHLTSTDFAQKTGLKITAILTSRLGKDWWEARCPLPQVMPVYFELAGLELPAAIAYAESLVPPTSPVPAKRGSRDTDFLVHIVNLLQRIPLAIKLVLPKAMAANPSFKDAFKAIHVGDVQLDYGSIKAPADYALVITLKEVYERFSEYQDIFCSLADFWIEGPLLLSRYISSLAATSGLARVYDMLKIVRVLNETGIWCVREQDVDAVEWLHPVFTLYLRQRRLAHAYRGAPFWSRGILKVADFLGSHKREHPFGSTASLRLAISRHYVSAVGQRGMAEVMVDMLMGHMHISDGDMAKPMQRMRRSLFNVLAALDMICRDDEPIPLQFWPRDYIGLFLSGSRLALSAPELQLLNGYLETLLDVFQKLMAGFAVPPDLQVFAMNLVVHFLGLSLPDGMASREKTERLLVQALAMIEASEAKYGPMTGDSRMWKAMVYRCQAVFLLLQRDEAGADAAWDRMKCVELEHFGPSAFQTSTFDAASSVSGQQPTGTSPLQNPVGFGGLVSKLQTATAAWVPVRHAAWPWIKGQVLSQGNTQALNQLHLPGVENAFENMVDSYGEAGWTGFNHWQHYFPPRNSLETYLRRAEDPEELLAQLEDGLGRGDWKVAAQAHQLLLKKAATEGKLKLVVFHLGQLGEILREADPDGAMTKQVTLAEDMVKLGVEVMERGSLTGDDYRRMVEAMDAAGVDVTGAWNRARHVAQQFVRLSLDAAQRGEDAGDAPFQDMVAGLMSLSGSTASQPEVNNAPG